MRSRNNGLTKPREDTTRRITFALEPGGVRITSARASGYNTWTTLVSREAAGRPRARCEVAARVAIDLHESAERAFAAADETLGLLGAVGGMEEVGAGGADGADGATSPAACASAAAPPSKRPA